MNGNSRLGRAMGGGRCLALMALVMTVTGCVSPVELGKRIAGAQAPELPYAPIVSAPGPGMGRVILFRQNRLMGAAVVFKLKLEQQSSGRTMQLYLRNGEYLPLDLPSGSWEVSTEMNRAIARTCRQTLEVSAGKPVAVEMVTGTNEALIKHAAPPQELLRGCGLYPESICLPQENCPVPTALTRTLQTTGETGPVVLVRCFAPTYWVRLKGEKEILDEKLEDGAQFWPKSGTLDLQNDPQFPLVTASFDYGVIKPMRRWLDANSRLGTPLVGVEQRGWPKNSQCEAVEKVGLARSLLDPHLEPAVRVSHVPLAITPDDLESVSDARKEAWDYLALLRLHLMESKMPATSYSIFLNIRRYRMDVDEDDQWGTPGIYAEMLGDIYVANRETGAVLFQDTASCHVQLGPEDHDYTDEELLGVVRACTRGLLGEFAYVFAELEKRRGSESL